MLADPGIVRPRYDEAAVRRKVAGLEADLEALRLGNSERSSASASASASASDEFRRFMKQCEDVLRRSLASMRDGHGQLMDAVQSTKTQANVEPLAVTELLQIMLKLIDGKDSTLTEEINATLTYWDKLQAMPTSGSGEFALGPQHTACEEDIRLLCVEGGMRRAWKYWKNILLDIIRGAEGAASTSTPSDAVAAASSAPETTTTSAPTTTTSALTTATDSSSSSSSSSENPLREYVSRWAAKCLLCRVDFVLGSPRFSSGYLMNVLCCDHSSCP